MLLVYGPLKIDCLNIRNGQQQLRNRTYGPGLLRKYILRSLQPTLGKIKPIKLLVTVTTGLEQLQILIAIYKTIITAIDLQFYKIKPVTGYPRNTLYISTYFHQRSKKRLTARRQPNSNLLATYSNLTAICRILPYSAKFCQDRSLNPILLHIYIN